MSREHLEPAFVLRLTVHTERTGVLNQVHLVPRRPHQSSFHHATVLTIAGDSYRLKAATRHQASRTPQEVPRQ